jgi:hypothetical protein
MLKGGTSAAGKTGAMMTGYTQYYQPLEVICFSKSVQTIMETKGTRAYNAYVTIEDLDGDEITISGCSYMQVQKYLSSGIDNASITVEKPELWSIWGNQYTEILKPSKRSITLYAGAAGKEIVLLRGRITGYSESIGGEGGAININISDHRATLQRIVPIALIYIRTRYCETHRLAFPTLSAAGMTLTINDKDVSGFFQPTQNNLNAIAETISGSPEWVGGGIMNVGSPTGTEILGDDLFLISDRIITYATRDYYDSSAFNAINIIGLRNGFVINKEIRDDIDIAKRGKILSSTVLGSDVDDLAEIELQAQRAIARALLGRLSVAITFQPYILPGQVVKIQSDRFNIPLTTARTTLVRHQYSHGNEATALDGLEVDL